MVTKHFKEISKDDLEPGNVYYICTRNQINGRKHFDPAYYDPDTDYDFPFIIFDFIDTFIKNETDYFQLNRQNIESIEGIYEQQ